MIDGFIYFLLLLPFSNPNTNRLDNADQENTFPVSVVVMHCDPFFCFFVCVCVGLFRCVVSCCFFNKDQEQEKKADYTSSMQLEVAAETRAYS